MDRKFYETVHQNHGKSENSSPKLVSSNSQEYETCEPLTPLLYSPSLPCDPTTTVALNNVSSDDLPIHTMCGWDNQRRRERSSTTDNGWNSAWLHGSTLTGLGLVFTFLVVTVASLFYVSRLHNGLSNQKASILLAYKYGPTTILVLVSALWHQLDYTCRMLVPLRGLLRETDAIETYLKLDYVSPMSFLVCYRAFKNAHWAVAASSAGTIALAFATGFSTGLLAVDTVEFSDAQVAIPINTTFSSLSFNSSFLEDPVMTFYGVETHGLPYPPGTSKGVAFQTVAIDKPQLQNSTLAVSVDAFIPSFNCEIALGRGVNLTSNYPGEYIIQATFESRNCRTTQSIVGVPDPYNIIFPPRLLYADTYRINCDPNTPWHESLVDASGFGSSWLFTIADTVLEQNRAPILNSTALQDSGRTLNVTSWSAQAQNVSAIFCNPSYLMGTADLLIDTSLSALENSTKVTTVRTGLNQGLPGFTNQQLSSALQVALTLTNLGKVEFGPLADAAQVSTSRFLHFISLINDQSSLEPLMNPLVLMDRAEEAYNGIASQMARTGLSIKQTSIATGSQTYLQNRLQVRSLSATVLCASFVMLICFTLVLYFFRPINLPIRSLDSTVSFALVLTTTPFLFTELKPVFQVKSWWKPFCASKPFTLSVVLFAVSLVVVLEVLGQRSNSLQGVSRVEISEPWAHALSTVLPAAIMMLLLAGFHSLYFAISTFAPFAKLITNFPPARISVMRNPTGKLPLTNLFFGVNYRFTSVAFASVAVIVGSFLTIVVAALYSIQPFDALSVESAEAVDMFYYTWHGPISGYFPDNGAGAVLGLVEQHNASYPDYTFEGLVYSRLQFPDGDQQLFKSANKGVVGLPAIRASLNCTYAPSGTTNVSYSLQQDPNLNILNEFVATYNADIAPISNCKTNGTFEISGDIRFPGASQGYGSAIIDLMSLPGFLPTCPTIAFLFGYFRNGSAPENTTLMVCNQNIEQVDTLTTFLLPSMLIDPTQPPVVNESRPRIVYADAPYEIAPFLEQNIPKFNSTVGTIGASNAAEISDESSLESFYQTVLYGRDGVPPEELMRPGNQDRFFVATQNLYRKYMAQLLNFNMRQNYTANPTASTSSIVSMGLTYATDPSSTATGGVIIIGKRLAEALPTTTASTTASSSKSTLTQAAIHSPTSTIVVPSFPATLQDSTALRIVQNRLSTIALQVMIGLMLVLSAVAYIMTPMQKVLPQNPCTIAGMMSLLVGSRLCEAGIIPKGAENMNNKELEKVFDGYVFRLGWWNVDTGQPMDPQGLNEKVTYRYGIDVMRKNNWGRV